MARLAAIFRAWRNNADPLPEARRRFEREHERLFGHIQPGGIIEITKLRLSGFGRVERLHGRAEATAQSRPAPAAGRSRSVWLDESHGWREIPVYDESELAPGHSLAGPLIVQEATTTILVGAADRIDVLSSGDYLIHVD